MRFMDQALGFGLKGFEGLEFSVWGPGGLGFGMFRV